VLVVSPGNDFISAEREDRPDPDVLPDDKSILDIGMQVSDAVGASRPATEAGLFLTIRGNFIHSG
jgi:hypothetical protein